MLGVAVRMAVGAGRRSAAYYMVIGAIVAVLATDSVYGWILLHGVLPPRRSARRQDGSLLLPAVGSRRAAPIDDDGLAGGRAQGSGSREGGFSQSPSRR